jgi:hypothetical protein
LNGRPNDPIPLAGFDLSDINFKGIDLCNCDFSNTVMREANFNGCDLENLKFINAEITNTKFIRTYAGKADFTGAKFTDVDFTSANLVETNFSSTRWSGASLDNARAIKTNFSEAHIVAMSTNKIRAYGCVCENTIFYDLSGELCSFSVKLEADRLAAVEEHINELSDAVAKRFRTNFTKLTPNATTSVLKCDDKIVGFKTRYDGHYRYVAEPTNRVDNGPAGGQKKLTHNDPLLDGHGRPKSYRSVILTKIDVNAKKQKGYDTFDDAAQKYIEKNKFSKLKIQYEIDDRRFMAEDAGINLVKLYLAGEFNFKAPEFVPLARQIQCALNDGWLFRDISDANLIRDPVSGEIAMSDLGTMVHVSEISKKNEGVEHPFRTSNAYLPKVLHGRDPCEILTYPGGSESVGKRIDQYCFFFAMFSAVHGTVNGGMIHDGFTQEPRRLNHFLGLLPFDRTLKNELKDFLLDPIKNRLTQPLEMYLLPPS